MNLSIINDKMHKTIRLSIIIEDFPTIISSMGFKRRGTNAYRNIITHSMNFRILSQRTSPVSLSTDFQIKVATPTM